MKINPSHLTIMQTARYVGVTHAAVRNAVNAKRVRTGDFEGTTMIPREDADAWKKVRKASARLRASYAGGAS